MLTTYQAEKTEWATVTIGLCLFKNINRIKGVGGGAVDS